MVEAGIGLDADVVGRDSAELLWQRIYAFCQQYG